MVSTSVESPRSIGTVLGSRWTIAALGLTVALAAGWLLNQLPPGSPHVLSSLVLVGLAFVLTYLSSSGARPVSAAFLFVLAYVVQVYVGMLGIYLQDGYSDPNIIAGGLFFLALGAYITGSHWGRRGQVEIGVVASPRLALARTSTWWAVGVGTIVVAVYTVLFYRSVGVPLLMSNIAQSFQDVSNAPRYTVIVLYNLPIIVSIVLLAQASHLRSRNWTLLAAVAGLVFAVIIITTARRWPVFYMALAWLIVLGQFGRLLRPRNVLIGLAVMVVLVGTVTYVGLARSPYLSTTQGGLPNEISFIVSQRLFAEQAQVVALIFRYFPHTYNFFGGYTFYDEFVRLPGSQPSFDFGSFLYSILDPNYSGDPNAKYGSAPPTFLGELYANFGLWPTMMLMGMWGALLGMWDRFARPLVRRGVIWLVLYTMLTMYLASSCIVGPYITFTNFGYNIALILLFVALPPVLFSRHGLRVGTTEALTNE